MTSRSPWKIQLIVTKGEEEVDWVSCNPGPEMRGYLTKCFGPRWDRSVHLVVDHLPSGTSKKAKIIKDRRRYRAKYNGELLTLEAAAKMMKEELRLHGRR